MKLSAFILFSALTGILAPTSFATGASDEHLAATRKRMPDDFTLVEEPPFVIVSDQDDRGQNMAVQTVRWAVVRLKKDFFAKDPTETIDIWIFKNKKSYEHNTREVFHEVPISPFGYYSPKEHALLISIAQGGGTLVHEIVHPFMRANFPRCPTWFDEGLASLFEQCIDRKGHIAGEINWRLPGLQETIRAGKTLSFQELTALSPTEFYASDGNSEYNKHYGQARYLCYYLQEQGLLVKFFKEFVANADKDPTGYATLQHVLGVDDMAAFQKKWEAFILALPAPK
ncbi:MAG: hypothetical protein QM715_07210 [Nibricoccus sp.]